MKIIITIENKKIKIALWKKNQEADFLEISDEHSLAEKLLPEIDRLLEKSGLTAADIEKIEVKSDQSDSFTTTRIAKTVAKAWEMRLEA